MRWLKRSLIALLVLVIASQFVINYFQYKQIKELKESFSILWDDLDNTDLDIGSRLDDLDSSISDLETSVGDVDSRTSDYEDTKTTIEELQTSVDHLESSLDSAKSRISSVEYEASSKIGSLGYCSTSGFSPKCTGY